MTALNNPEVLPVTYYGHFKRRAKNFYHRRKWFRRFLLFLLLILVLKLLSSSQPQRIMRIVRHRITHYISNEGEPDASFLRYDVACRIPKLNPFHSHILHLIDEGPEETNCEDQYPLLFKSTFTSTLTPLKTQEEMEQLGIKSCCYKIIYRFKTDHNYALSKICYPVSLVETTVVPKGHEFIAIECVRRNFTDVNATFTKIVDIHAFVHLKANVERRIENMTEKEEQKDRHGRLNVLIFGIDTVSHMNFLRTMPQSYSFLMNELEAVEMHGYHKVGYNTLPNLAAMLASQTADEGDVNSTCEEEHTFDKCSFIWKNYSTQGYRTSYGEDVAVIGTFNYAQEGFKKPPTDYYLRHFAVAGEHCFYHPEDTGFCYGPRLAFEVVLNYIQKFAYTMGFDRRYFQFILSASITHEYLNNGLLVDKLLRSTLEWFRNGGYFNQTLFLLVSDHGFRKGEILDFQQGRLEKRMPFLFIVVPPWFKEKYSRAYQNLMKNQDKLTTPFDVYETLKDLLALHDIPNEEIEKRELTLKFHEMNASLPRGISHFLPIPLSRTCKMAGIENYFCVCRNLSAISTGNLAVRQAANYAVYYINSVLSKYPQCAFLSLSFVKNAKAGMTHSGDEDYQINFETSPGDASFEAVVLRDKSGNWTVSGTIDRTNSYGSQSSCVDTRLGKLYCYCTNLSPEFKLNNTEFKI